MKKKQIILLIGAIFGAVVILSLLLVLLFKQEYAVPQDSSGGLPNMLLATRQDVSGNVPVPYAKTIDQSANVAIPNVVSPADYLNTASFRSYNIKIEGGKFMPDTIVVNQRDEVRINFTAADKDYDVVQPDYGFKFSVNKGEMKIFQFNADAQGDYLFYCEMCGGPSKGPRGHIIVVPPKIQ